MILINMQVIAATNRADILDPALMRSGRLDRKIEFPHPTEDARARILQVSTLAQYRILILHLFFFLVVYNSTIQKKKNTYIL